jgi:hypothetical protein
MLAPSYNRTFRTFAMIGGILGTCVILCVERSAAQSPIATPVPSVLTLYATGGANFAPSPAAPSNSAGGAPAPAPTPFTPWPKPSSNPVKPPLIPEASGCTAKYTEVSFRITCQSDPTSPSANVCRGSMSFYGLDLNEIVEGPLKSNPDGSFTVTLHSPEGSITDCVVASSPATEGTVSVTLASCQVGSNGCSGDVSGSGRDHSISSNAFLNVEPAE